MSIEIVVTYRVSCDWRTCRAAMTVPGQVLEEVRRRARQDGWTVAAVHDPSGYATRVRCPAHAYLPATPRTGRPRLAQAVQ